MKLTKTKSILATAGLACICLSTPMTSTAQQDEKLAEVATLGATKITAKLKGYVFGLRVIKVNVAGSLTDDAYAIRADLYTSGVGAFLK